MLVTQEEKSNLVMEYWKSQTSLLGDCSADQLMGFHEGMNMALEKAEERFMKYINSNHNQNLPPSELMGLRGYYMNKYKHATRCVSEEYLLAQEMINKIDNKLREFKL